MLDEVYEYAKKSGTVDKLNTLIKKKYNPTSIQTDLQSYYDVSNSPEYKAIMGELETKIKQDDRSLYNLWTYTKEQSFEVLSALLNSVKNLRDRFVILDKCIAYKISTAYEYEILVSLLCTMYEEAADNIKRSLPKYIHIAYVNYASIKYCLTKISTSGNLDIFDEYEKYIDKVYARVNEYIDSKDTLQNLRLETRCAALQYILPRLSPEDKLKTLAKIEKLVDLDILTFDNKYNSIGVIWTYERLYETYFDLGKYHKFFKWVYKQYEYMDNALSDKATFFDALRYYNKNNITGFIISMRRFYKIQNLFPLFNMEFDNISQSDEDFITDPMLDYTLYDDYANKLVMEKFKNYVDAWYLNNSNRLNDIAKNKDLLLKCKKYVLEGIEPEEENKSTNADYDSAEHPENTSTVIPGEFVEEPEATETPSLNVPTLPDGFNVDMGDLSRLSERAVAPTDVINTDTLLKLEREGEDPEIPATNNAVTTEVIPEPPVVPVFTPSRLPTEEELNTITETSAVPEHPVTEEPTVPPPAPVVSPTEPTAEPVAPPVAVPEQPVAEEPTVPSVPPAPAVATEESPAVPALPGNFAVNEDELNSLSEEERAAMSAMNEE